MLYVKSRKSFGGEKRIKILLLCRVAKKKHTAKYIFVVYYIFAVCAHGRVSDRKHTAHNQIPVGV